MAYFETEINSVASAMGRPRGLGSFRGGGGNAAFEAVLDGFSERRGRGVVMLHYRSAG